MCLKPHHEETAEAPAIQPVVPEGQVVPFIYAMPHQDRAGKLAAPVPRYRNKWGLLRGREPLDHLVGNRQYSFVTEDRSTSVGRYLVDKKERVVRSSHMKKERPSEFGGRPLAERPLVEGLAAGWIVRYRVELRDKPHPTRSKVVKKLEHHVELDVDPERHRAKGEAYYAVPDAIAPGVPGYLSDRDVHLWIPGPPLAEVGDDELWIDVELGQQTLAIMRGQDPEYVTLISSGNGKHPTPRGLYRLRSKLGLGKMRSLPDSPSDEEYYVEDVPWVQYFYKRYALHTSYWHNRFGWRHSHGCINLAPRDSSYLFSQTAPALPEGWISVHENDGDPGTLLRVRRGKEPVEDRRRPLSEVDPEDDELAEGIDDGDGGDGDE